jgi:transposase
MTMLAEVIDAVIGIDTHRDSHEVEIADPAGKPIAAMRIGNDSAGFAQLLAAIAELSPGPRWRSASRAPVAMAWGWRGRWPPLACW